MRRALIRGLGALLLFAAGAGLGLSLAGETLPGSLRSAVEVALSDAFGTPVEIEGARLLVFPGLTVEATGLRAWPGADGPAFTARRLEAALEMPSLSSGRLRFSSIALDDVSLELERAADDHWTPPLLSPGFRSPLVVLQELFSAELPARTIDIRSGRLRITDLGLPRAAGGPGRFTLDGLQLRLLGPRVLSRGRLTLRGRLSPGRGDPAPIELEATAKRGVLPGLELAATGLPLEPLQPYLQKLRPGLKLAGSASGVVTVAPAPGNETVLGLDLVLSNLRSGRDVLGWPQPPLAADRLSAEVGLRIGPEALVLEDGRFDADGRALSLAGSLGRPVGEESSLAFEGRLDELGVAELQRLGGFLPEQARSGFERALLDLRSGRFEGLTLSGDAPLARWLRRDPAHDPWLPEGALLSASVDDLTFGPPGGEAVSTVRGTVHLRSPDTLVVSDLEGTLEGRPLPHLDLRLAGLAHLMAVQPAPVPPVPALAGRAPLEKILRGDPQPDDAPADWRSLDIEADWLHHPAFFRPLRDVKVHLEPTHEGVRLALAHASWGDIPIHGEGSWVTRPPESARLSLEAGPPTPLPGVAPGAQSWAHGRFSLTRQPGAGFRVEQLEGGFDVAGAQLTIFDASARLGVPGRLTGDARLDLAETDRVPAQLRFSLADARAPDLLAAMSDDPADSSGTVDIEGRLAGSLIPGRRVLTTMDGHGSITALDGELGVDLPVLLAIAKASTTFNPFASADGIRFDRISAELRVDSGVLRTKRTLTIESPDLRLAISGSIDVRETPSQLEAVVGCFFFKPLDQVLGAVPVLSRILLGPDRSLFGTYFELTGPLASPHAGMIPTRTLALGPATFLMEDVPSFVKQGVEAIQGILPSLGGEAPAVASPAEAADPMGDGS